MKLFDDFVLHKRAAEVQNEHTFELPIVSVSLRLPATFLLCGLNREDKTIWVPVAHGDVMV